MAPEVRVSALHTLRAQTAGTPETLFLPLTAPVWAYAAPVGARPCMVVTSTTILQARRSRSVHSLPVQGCPGTLQARRCMAEADSTVRRSMAVSSVPKRARTPRRSAARQGSEQPDGGGRDMAAYSGGMSTGRVRQEFPSPTATANPFQTSSPQLGFEAHARVPSAQVSISPPQCPAHPLSRMVLCKAMVCGAVKL